MCCILEYLSSRPMLGLVGTTSLILLVFVAACEEQLPPAACGSISPLTTIEGERSAVTACFTDPNGDVLSYTATSANPEVATASAAAEMITVTAVSPGNTSVTVTASDPNGMLAKVSFEVTVLPDGPDLLFTEVMPRSVTVSPGDTATAEFTVANAGTQPSGSTRQRVFQSADSTITTSDRFIASLDPLDPLGPSEEVSYTLRFVINANSGSGIIYMGVCVDVVPGEANEGNNCSPAFKITITASSTQGVSDADSESASGGFVTFLPASAGLSRSPYLGYPMSTGGTRELKAFGSNTRDDTR